MRLLRVSLPAVIAVSLISLVNPPAFAANRGVVVIADTGTLTATPANSGTHCNQDVCMQVDSEGGSGPYINYVAVWLRSGHLANNDQVQWWTGPSWNGAPRSLKGAKNGPWVEENDAYPFGAYFYPPNLYITPGYLICGVVTDHSGDPCITVES